MPLTRKTTLDFIEEQLQLSYKKIDLINQLKFEARAARSNEVETLNEIQRTNSGIIALALEHEHQIHKKQGIDYQPFLLESDRQKDLFADFLAGLPSEEIYRFHLIIGGRGLHATPVVIESDGTGTKIFSLDAALYYDNFNCIDMFSLATNAQTFQYTGGGIQNSAFGCTIFSIGHLREMAKMNANDLTDMFSDAMSRKTDQYIGLRPEFVTNMQSIGGMDRYLGSRPDATIIKEAKELNTQRIFDKNSIKLRNYSITKQNHEVLGNASLMLKNLTEEEFQDIFEKRTGMQALEQAHKNLSPEQITQVNGIYNLDKIDLILNNQVELPENTMGFGPRQIDSRHAASLFKTGDTELLSIAENFSGPQLELVRKGHGVDHLAGKQKEECLGKQYAFDLQVLEALERGTAFDKIKDCTNSYTIEAISKYNIDPELANSSICFEDPKNQAIAISFIRKAYKEAEEGQKEHLARTVFCRIKENPCNLNHEIAALYKEAVKTISSPAGITERIYRETIIPDPLVTREWTNKERNRKEIPRLAPLPDF
jgi:hypothetical protein